MRHAAICRVRRCRRSEEKRSHAGRRWPAGAASPADPAGGALASPPAPRRRKGPVRAVSQGAGPLGPACAPARRDRGAVRPGHGRRPRPPRFARAREARRARLHQGRGHPPRPRPGASPPARGLARRPAEGGAGEGDGAAEGHGRQRRYVAGGGGRPDGRGRRGGGARRRTVRRRDAAPRRAGPAGRPEKDPRRRAIAAAGIRPTPRSSWNSS